MGIGEPMLRLYGSLHDSTGGRAGGRRAAGQATG